MTKTKHLPLFLLRISMGWFFFYAGITKVLDPAWSAAGYIKGAKSFVWFYHALLHPSVLPVVNFLNEWGLTLLGLSLIIGAFVRLSSWLGVILMALYYFVILDFPYPNTHAFIVDEHVIYALVLVVFASTHAGRAWGFDALRERMTKSHPFRRLWEHLS